MCKTETNIECCICFKTLVLSALMFVCGHMCCIECVKSLDKFSIEIGIKFKCPYCRRETSYAACIRVNSMKSPCGACKDLTEETDLNQTLITPCGHLFCEDW
jgi:hypothetical protein